MFHAQFVAMLQSLPTQSLRIFVCAVRASMNLHEIRDSDVGDNSDDAVLVDTSQRFVGAFYLHLQG
jgi:hypothetical protein